jgi:hypothetical protein
MFLGGGVQFAALGLESGNAVVRRFLEPLGSAVEGLRRLLLLGLPSGDVLLEELLVCGEEGPHIRSGVGRGGFVAGGVG